MRTTVHNDQVGDVLRKMRESGGLTQKQLADRLGRYVGDIAAREKGAVEIGLVEAHQWAEACGQRMFFGYAQDEQAEFVIKLLMILPFLPAPVMEGLHSMVDLAQAEAEAWAAQQGEPS